MKNYRGRSVALNWCALVCALVQAAGARDLTDASLEDLMNMPVTSVSKREQKLSQAGAAVFVITQEDIRRSGATNIPDLLRMAPGVDVAQIDANKWAISIRGFNDQHADKVLVLIDGRSVYSPSFSGVFWESQDVPLEDIDRIEIIRGAGGTMWGANAVNGVINIITKKAADTQGGLVSAGTGSGRAADGLVQYGGTIGATGTYRLFGKYFDVTDSVLPNGAAAADGWHMSHAGFRSDWTLSQTDTLTVQGDALAAGAQQTVILPVFGALPPTGTFNDPISATDGNVLGRWNHILAGGSEISVQIYDDYSHHVELGFSDQQNTVDLDFQHHLTVGKRQDIVWGFGTRMIDSNYGVAATLTILPNHRFDRLFSTFLQDEIKLTGSLTVTVGSKFEHNDFTGFEMEPSAQLVWTPTAQHTFWISAARAIQEPSSVDFGLQDEEAIVPVGQLLGVVEVMGNPNLRAERANDFEAGYRANVTKRLSLDVTGFVTLFRDVVSVEAQNPYVETDGDARELVLPLVFVNGSPIHTTGAEFFGTWNVTRRWRISPGYSLLHMTVPNPATQVILPGVNPEHQLEVRSLFDLGRNWEWDNSVAYVDRLPAANVPAYTRVDSRLGWRAGEHLEFSIVGQNLLTGRHVEFYAGPYPTIPSLVERSVFAKVTWRF